MALAETEAEMAAWYIRLHQWEQVREMTEAALHADPKLSLAHEDKGFLLFNEGKDEDALKEFSTAGELDSKNYVARFAELMVSSTVKPNSPQIQQAIYDGLNQLLETKPDFAPAYVELAKLSISQGRLDSALGLSRKAEQLEPFRSGYHVLSGQILLQLNRPSEAAAEAAYVAERWNGSDRDEAMELWEKVPPSDRHTNEPISVPVDAKWQTAQGTVKSVVCNGSAYAITS